MRKLALLIALLLCLSLTAAATPAQTPIRVLGLVGPTGMSLAPMMRQADPAYHYSLAAAPEELVGSIVSGNYDIAALPTNTAALLYQKTKGQLKMLAINTLGVLYLLEKGDSVHQAADLSGRSIALAGQGAVPEYAMRYILDVNGVKDVTLDFKSEHNEASALAAAGKADLVLLPQPMALALQMKEPAFRIALDITQAFQEAAALDGKPDAVLSMGCLVVRADFADKQPEAIAAFLQAYQASVRFVNEEPALAAKDIVAAGILPNEKMAEKAIPLCHIVYVAGLEMQAQLSPLFQILYAANPQAVGGALPDEAFYYQAK